MSIKDPIIDFSNLNLEHQTSKIYENISITKNKFRKFKNL